MASYYKRKYKSKITWWWAISLRLPDGSRRRIARPGGPTKSSAQYALVDYVKKNRISFEKDHRALAPLIVSYINYCRDRHAITTIARELPTLRDFQKFCDDIRIIFINQISIKNIEDYLSRRLMFVKKRSANRDIDVLRAFFTRCVEWGVIELSPMAKLKKFTIPESEPKDIPSNDLQRFFQACLDDPVLARLIKAFLMTGLRRRELMAMKWDQIQEEYIIIPATGRKNKKTLYVPLDDELSTLLADQRRYVNELDAESPWIFPSQKDPAKHWDDPRKRVALVCKRAGIAQFTIHQLRHTFAYRAIDANVNVRDVQSLLGHSDLRSTEIYTKRRLAALSAAVAKIRHLSQ